MIEILMVRHFDEHVYALHVEWSEAGTILLKYSKWSNTKIFGEKLVLSAKVVKKVVLVGVGGISPPPLRAPLLLRMIVQYGAY